MNTFFDYHAAARDAKLSSDVLARIEEGIRSEYPHDDMLFELHVLRACRVIAQGEATVQQVLDSLPPSTQAA